MLHILVSHLKTCTTFLSFSRPALIQQTLHPYTERCPVSTNTPPPPVMTYDLKQSLNVSRCHTADNTGVGDLQKQRCKKIIIIITSEKVTRLSSGFVLLTYRSIRA